MASRNKRFRSVILNQIHEASKEAQSESLLLGRVHRLQSERNTAGGSAQASCKYTNPMAHNSNSAMEKL